MSEIQPNNSSRVSNKLLNLYEEFTKPTLITQTTDNLQNLSPITDIVQVDETRVIVRITSSDVEGLLPDLENLGFEVLGSAPNLNFVEGWMPINSIPQLENLETDKIMGVVPVYAPLGDAGLATSQADFIQEADRVRSSLPSGFDGTGVTIGVMSDSYNVSGNGSATADIASGDLPAEGVKVLQEGPSNATDEGRAMLQLIHDLAPGSDLAFSSVFYGQLNYAQQIRDLADPTKGDAQVLVDDIVYLDEPFFQDGVIAQAVDDVVTNNGVTYFASAGNRSRAAYESTSFNAVSDGSLDGILGSPDGSLYYDFNLGAGTDTRQQITLDNNERFIPSFQWDDPFYTVSGVDTNLDIFLLDSSGRVVAASNDNNIFFQTPFEAFSFTNTTGNSQNYDFVIRLTEGPASERIKYVDFGGSEITSEYPLDAPTVNPHSAAVNAQAVAAIPYYDQTTPEEFTSQGPSVFLFEPDGTRKATPEIRQTPDIAAVDGTDTTFFGSPDFDGTGYPNFFGTSAAAPHAAAIAALITQANPTFTPAQIYETLQSTAIDIDPPGFDNVTGYGLINTYDAMFGSIVATSLDFNDNFEDGDLPLAYETNSNGAGRIQVTTENNPIGSQHLTLDTAFDRFSLNEVILHVDTSGFNNVQLGFSQREFGDFDHPMPATFTGSNDSDGVALSVDGTNWFRLISLTGNNSTETYQRNTFNLSEFAANNGLNLNSNVQIKFQQFGLSGIDSVSSSNSSNGFAFDNISVTGTPIPNSPQIAISDSSGNPNDAAIQFTTALSEFGNTSDSDLVRPTDPDNKQYFDITNSGDATLTISEVRSNINGVTTNLDFSQGDIILNPNESQRVQLSYTPTQAGEAFNLRNGIVVVSNAVNSSEMPISLSGKSTFESDINYDGIVGFGDLGPLNANWGLDEQSINWNPTVDINGDGFVGFGDLGLLNQQWNQAL